MPEQAERHGSVGGRHQRARSLARRRSDCEPLGDYEQRLLDAHMRACARCRSWSGELPEATVPAGQRTRTPATVSGVEAASTAPESGERKHIGPENDAMGLDKRRAVVGQGYGPSKGRQIIYYAVFIGLLVLLYFGGRYAVDQLDKAPSHNPATAPWAQPPAKQQPPPQQFQ
ncbi:MAG TPA: hypothetical protein VF030_07350 [Solirubrobacterales bacterium]